MTGKARGLLFTQFVSFGLSLITASLARVFFCVDVVCMLWRRSVVFRELASVPGATVLNVVTSN
jgi:hypothetical protein